MALVRPRLNDYYDIPFAQEDMPFAIPFLDEDIPLYVDPFLLWKSPSQQDNYLHLGINTCFNDLGHLVRKGKNEEAESILIRASECPEIGLGTSKSRKGKRISLEVAANVLSLFRDIPQLRDEGFTHLEEIQLLVDQISKDRISDIACTFLKSFLVDFTFEQSQKYKIPVREVNLEIYSHKAHRFDQETVSLPYNPENGDPILFVPKRWLRYVPWIHFDDYFEGYYCREMPEGGPRESVAVLNYNRRNYDMVQAYVKARELLQADCRNDPLFTPIPVVSATRKLTTILGLPTGKTDNADKKYEEHVCQLMASLLYPSLDFAAMQSRTDSGVLIRDLVFYNNRTVDFLQDIHQEYGSRQIVMELKNVQMIEREHVNQLNRYLNDELGRFGVIITRNRLPQNIRKSLIDLWSGQRRCIIALTDEDLRLMVSVFESKQRSPIEVLKKKYIEFKRECPS